MMELDHFRPESLFNALRNEPTNLVYACRSCNGKKRHDWPAGEGLDTHVAGEGYLDPFSDDRQSYFRIRESGEIEPLNPPASYLIGRLGLNRPLLKNLRRRALLRWRLAPKVVAAVALLKLRIQAAPDQEAIFLKEVLSVIETQQEMQSLC